MREGEPMDRGPEERITTDGGGGGILLSEGDSGAK